MRTIIATMLSLLIVLFSTSSFAGPTTAIIYTKNSHQAALNLEQINKILPSQLEKQLNSTQFKAQIASEKNISVDEVGHITVSHAKLSAVTEGKYMLTFYSTSTSDIVSDLCHFINTNQFIGDLILLIIAGTGPVGELVDIFVALTCDPIG